MSSYESKEIIMSTIAPLPKVALYYNRWNGLKTKHVSPLFILLTFEEVAGLSEGTQIWFDQDPIHPQGKVYGFLQRTITGVDKLSETQLGVNFNDGFSRIKKGGQIKLYRLLDENALRELIKSDPRIGTRS